MCKMLGPRKKDISQFCSSLQKLKDAIKAGSRQDDLEVNAKSAPVGELSVVVLQNLFGQRHLFFSVVEDKMLFGRR